MIFLKPNRLSEASEVQHTSTCCRLQRQFFFFQITFARSECRGARSPTEVSELPEIIPAGRERTSECLSLTRVQSLVFIQRSLIEQVLQSDKGQILPSVSSPLSSWWDFSLPAPSYRMMPRWQVRASLADSEHWPGVWRATQQSTWLGRSCLDMGDLCSCPALPPAGLLASDK